MAQFLRHGSGFEVRGSRNLPILRTSDCEPRTPLPYMPRYNGAIGGGHGTVCGRRGRMNEAPTDEIQGDATGGRRLFAKIISGTDAASLERAVNAALATIPLTARPNVSMIAPLGDRVRLYAL